MFTLIDSSGDGVLSCLEFKNGMSRLVECSPFQSLCILLPSINSVKGLVNELKATSAAGTIRKNSNVSALEEVASPDCLRKDLAILRRELQDMKAALTSKINNLSLLLRPVETLHQSSPTVGNMPVWVPLPPTGKGVTTVGKRSKSLTSEGCTSRGTAEEKNAVKQLSSEDAPNTTEKSVEDSGMNPSTHDIFVLVNDV